MKASDSCKIQVTNRRKFINPLRNRLSLSKIQTKCGDILEAAPGVEPGDKGFAILCLTAWLCRHAKTLDYLNIRNSIMEVKTTENIKLSVDNKQIMITIIPKIISID